MRCVKGKTSARSNISLPRLIAVKHITSTWGCVDKSDLYYRNYSNSMYA